MKKIDYVPPLHYYMYPAPGPLAKLPEAKGALAGSIFEQHPPFTNNPVAAEFVKLYNEGAAKAGLADNAVETQAAASFSAWQVLEAAITATNSLDDKAMAQWLKKKGAKDAQRHVRFEAWPIAFDGRTGYARWHATFERVPSGARVELDGVLAAQFDSQMHCVVFREWWHRREAPGGACTSAA